MIDVKNRSIQIWDNPPLTADENRVWTEPEALADSFTRYLKATTPFSASASGSIYTSQFLACRGNHRRRDAYPTKDSSRPALLAINRIAIARTYNDSVHFVPFTALPLDFVSITTDTSCNTLAAPLADRATSPLDDVHQGRVIFLRSSYLRQANEEQPL